MGEIHLFPHGSSVPRIVSRPHLQTFAEEEVDQTFAIFSNTQITHHMFTNNQRQEDRTGKYGTPRLQYLQELVSQFQNASSEELKEKIVANLANFAYDPYNYVFLRQLNVLELFLDCITEPNEKLIEFGAGGICNSCIDPANAAVIVKCDGVPLLIQCLSSPVKNTVNYALGALYYLCNASTKEAILRPEVVDIIKRYAAAGAVSVSFSNLAQAFLDKHVPENP
ncbi:hypothetical protein QVD17_26158 [Tagetes erecta]|uniref:Armadillo repeat-containing protein 7 n=1 Tax=Tagetes erecta TaxID=13708 RepID=A0AAD8K8U8_TARER|nr:hypothetical protein QVD17_26158 [Tagetes erecta]